MFITWLWEGLVLCLLIMLEACSPNVCSIAGAPGTYTVTFKKVAYLLQLNPQDTGFLSVAGKNISNFQWELDDLPGGDQAVALTVPPEIANVLDNITESGFKKTISPIKTEYAISLLLPKCDRHGYLQRLITDVDFGIGFSRVTQK